MSLARQLAQASQEQHNRYYALFSTDPATGDGWRNLGAHIRSIARDVDTTRQQVIASNFSTTVLPRYSHATRSDTTPFDQAAIASDVFARVTDNSARINVEGANAIAANAQAEASAISLVPDPDSPDGLAQILAIVEHHQSRSAAIVTQASQTEAELGQQAAAAGDDTDPNDDHIQLVDHTTAPEAPPFPLPNAPWQYNIDLTSQIEAGKFGEPTVNAGTLASIEDVWRELHRCFNCNFPMGGAPKEFPKVGDELPLEIRTAGQKLLNFPVRVTEISRTADAIDIEFVTLPGHVDGPDSTIHFRFAQDGGQLHLTTTGLITQGPGSGDIPIFSPGIRTGYTAIAYNVWQPYINNLTRHIADAKGYATYGPGS